MKNSEAIQNRKFSFLTFSNSSSGRISLYGIAILIVLVFFIVVVFMPQFFKLRTGIYRLACKEIRHKIHVAIEQYGTENTRKIAKEGKSIDLDLLKSSGFLMEIQSCPENGKYIFGPLGDVLCTQHYPSPEPQKEEKGTTK